MSSISAMILSVWGSMWRRPVLVLLLGMMLGGVATAGLMHLPVDEPGVVATSSGSKTEEQWLKLPGLDIHERPKVTTPEELTAEVAILSNQQRVDAGLAPLQRNPMLDQSASAKLEHMLENGYWAHDAPDGTTPWYFFDLSGYRHDIAGENLARDFDTSRGVVDGWMDSPSHRDNMLTPGYTEMGVAAKYLTLGSVSRGWLIVAHYAKPL
jgi:uncharacterized protein YkwD